MTVTVIMAMRHLLRSSWRPSRTNANNSCESCCWNPLKHGAYLPIVHCTHTHIHITGRHGNSNRGNTAVYYRSYGDKWREQSGNTVLIGFRIIGNTSHNPLTHAAYLSTVHSIDTHTHTDKSPRKPFQTAAIYDTWLIDWVRLNVTPNIMIQPAVSRNSAVQHVASFTVFGWQLYALLASVEDKCVWPRRSMHRLLAFKCDVQIFLLSVYSHTDPPVSWPCLWGQKYPVACVSRSPPYCSMIDTWSTHLLRCTQCDVCKSGICTACNLIHGWPLTKQVSCLTPTPPPNSAGINALPILHYLPVWLLVSGMRTYQVSQTTHSVTNDSLT